MAVSTSADATGTYYEYQFPLGNDFPDYPKWGIWPTGYFETNNAFGNTAYVNVCAYNSAKLLVGDRSAEQICFQTSTNDTSLLPGDLDSNVPPPTGQDEFFIGSYLEDPSNSHLYLYSMHPVYSNPEPVDIYRQQLGAIRSPCLPTLRFVRSASSAFRRMAPAQKVDAWAIA